MRFQMEKIMTLLFLGLSSVSLADEGDFTLTNTSFQDLFNNHRIGQPKNPPWAGSYWPYAKKGINVGASAHEATSPAQKFDQYFDLDKETQNWENKYHSCLGDNNVEGCKDWWGHCNAWSAAAVKEPQPVATTSGGFTVADQKAFLTELWMDSGTLFAGNSAVNKVVGPWIYSPTEADLKKDEDGVSNYSAFWDVTPRSFFMIFTNYIGLMQMGLIIDQYTGDQVWNQPVVGYRIFPLRKSDISQVTQDGQSLTSVALRAKIYWAEDEVPLDVVSKPLVLGRSESDDQDESDGPLPGENGLYSARFLKFKLFFDGPVTVSEDGLSVTTTAEMIGDGIWGHQEVPVSMDKAAQSHPDFIWLPTDLTDRDSGNAYVQETRVRQILAGNLNESNHANPAPEETETHTIELSDSLASASLKSKIKVALNRNGVTAESIDLTGSRGHYELSVVVPKSVLKETVISDLKEAGLHAS
jgi:hypothetical protein